MLFQHKSTAPMIYILTFENNLLPGKYFSHFWENRFHLLGNLKITLYQINTLFHFWGTSCFLFWEMTCDLVTNRFLELSYEESLLFSHKSTAPMIYIFLPWEITFEIPLLGKSITLQVYLDFLIMSHYL